MSGWKKLAAASAADDVISPEAVSFDGSNDYLQRSFSESVRSEMTFSAWVYASPYTNNKTFFRNGATTAPFEFNVQVQADGDLEFRLTTGNQNKSAYANNKAFGFNTWNHILFSIDASTGAAQLYINDRNVGIGTTGVAGEDIKPLLNNFQIMKGEATGKAKGRVANVFVDYTYRNLGTESNRRLFITDELKPADGLADLSPIIYLPMTDADTAGTNAGTGGDFTVTGTVDTAARGPNQNNCVASEFDGSNDYLSNSISQVDGSVLTCSFIFKQNSTNTVSFNAYDGGSPSASTQVQNANYANPFRVILRNTSGGQICNLESSFRVPQYSQASVQVSLDISNSGDRKVQMFLNGVADTSITETFYTSDTTFRLASNAYIGGGNGAEYHNGAMGEFYLDAAYIDLASDNPFWDGDAGLPKPVRQVLDETGNTPLIAMPIIASNSGDNLGTDSDFTVNGGTFGGARGGSEFVSRSLYTNGSGYLSRTSLTGAADSKTFTLAIALKYTRSSVNEPFAIASSNTTSCVRTYCETGGKFSFQAYNSSDTRILLWESQNGVLPLNEWAIVLFSVNLASSTAHFYVDGVSVSTTADTLTNDFIDLSNINKVTVGADTDGTDVFDDALSLCYFSTDYHDFSQEENRFKFVDQLGYPRDLSQQIADGVISDPLIYTPFTATADLGANAGTGGDFTISGTVGPGDDVDVDG